jgi:hypothetical protein
MDGLYAAGEICQRSDVRGLSGNTDALRRKLLELAQRVCSKRGTLSRDAGGELVIHATIGGYDPNFPTQHSTTFPVAQMVRQLGTTPLTAKSKCVNTVLRAIVGEARATGRSLDWNQINTLNKGKVPSGLGFIPEIVAGILKPLSDVAVGFMQKGTTEKAIKEQAKALAREAALAHEESEKQFALAQAAALLAPAQQARNQQIIALVAIGGIALLISGSFLYATIKAKKGV